MLEAEFVRKFPGKSLPFFQELRDNFTADEPLVKVQPCLHVSRAREQGSRPQITCEC